MLEELRTLGVDVDSLLELFGGDVDAYAEILQTFLNDLESYDVVAPLSNGEYECLITNLPASDFSALEIGKLYNMRWGIETSFRTLKYTVGLLYFHSKKADFVKQEIWSRLIMYNVFAIITFNASSGKEKEKKYRYQPNLTDALHICRQFLKNHVATKDLDCLILGLLLPIRPDRQAPRKKKNHFSIGFLYRTV